MDCLSSMPTGSSNACQVPIKADLHLGTGTKYCTLTAILTVLLIHENNSKQKSPLYKATYLCTIKVQENKCLFKPR